MRAGLLSSKDFWGGLMLIALGVAAVLVARGYAFGTVLRMGPGYFPTMLGIILVLFGLCVFAQGLRNPEPMEGGWSMRALIVLPVAFALFGFLMDRAGFVPALAVLIVASAAASSSFRLVEVALMTAVLTAACVAVFIWGLGLPYRLIAGF
jgi:Tripartite tricarboxylate transporter TctB family